MRVFRGLTIATLVLAAAGTADAQASRGFKDSWFWGVKGGLHMAQVRDNGVDKTPLMIMGGADWLITRSSGGLMLSFDHSLLKVDSLFVNDSLSPLDSVPRVVRLRGLRRFTLAGMLFPMQTYFMHPYFGLGVTFSSIAEATPMGTYRNATQKNLVESTIDAFRSTASPVVIIGSQFKFPLVSLFGQATITPANNNFFLFTGSNLRATLETGVRFNVGSSIDRPR